MNTAGAGHRPAFRPDLLAEQVTVATGGGAGIGRRTAHEPAALGATPLLVGRTPGWTAPTTPAEQGA